MPASRTHSLPRSAAVAAVVAAALGAGLLAGTSSASAAEVRIHDIQGTTRISPLAGQKVEGVPGIVTGIRTYGSSKGFWFQDAAPDDNAATSEGVFVFTSSNPTVAVGDSVTVSGTVSEYVPGGASGGNQSLTEISKPTVALVSSGNPVPAATVLNSRSVPDRYTPGGDTAAANSINGLTLQPKKYALDLYESLEGMNVRVGSSRVTTATDAYAELWVTVKPHENATRRGGSLYASYEDQNTGRLQIQSLIPTATEPFPTADVGDVVTSGAQGPLDYNSFGGYTLLANNSLTVKDNGLKPEVTRKQRKGELAVATYNVENLDPTDPQSKFDNLAAAVVDNLASPDIVALEEIQDNNGAKNDGTVDSSVTVKKFTDAIVAAGGPAYEARTIDPVDGKSGGEPGGNIRQVFLFNPDRVSFTDIPGGDATTATTVVGANGRANLSASPGRIDPSNAAWNASRVPLVGQFSFRGSKVFVIANHFSSKGGDFGLTSQFQPVPRSSETQRHLQAQAVNTFTKEILKADRHASVLALGDINDFDFSDTTKLVEAGGALYSGIRSLPKSERYTYDYQGNSQVLDQILVSPSIREDGFFFDSVHINSEFAAQNSDHDPQVIHFRP
ncbi:endonuclease/exonuclease/phosphatase family protein [Streptomyces beijiangensis]|uniref:Endonuclease/exonuclease/phosphatase family protein n=1 Tax=Streptomyces beijiangensis TaxID=163361 RepID=A0A939JLR4_9ACTN|nr:endonuclease/exonuclease/phosphatase family protein [Streptomyces beijiangensis]MBO0516004.1 endonuclease/exonuclease/phosphatase family protein [Streptomyces beijiangensis]